VLLMLESKELYRICIVLSSFKENIFILFFIFTFSFPHPLRPHVYGGIIWLHAPMSVISLIHPSQMPASTPVKPHPDTPPLSVKIVTVWPICLNRLSNKQSDIFLSSLLIWLSALNLFSCA